MNTGVKTFSLGVLKLACAIVAAVFVLGLTGWVFLYFSQEWQEAANEPLATLKVWPEVTGLSGSQFNLQTVWRSGSIYYQVDVRFSPPLRQAWNGDAGKSFTIIFLDKDGFKLFQHDLPLEEMTGFAGKDGRQAGRLWKGDELMNVDLYRRAASWTISWRGFADLPDQ